MSKKSDTNLRNKFSSFFGGGQRSQVSARSPPEEFNLDSTTLNVSLRVVSLNLHLWISHQKSFKVSNESRQKNYVGC